MNAKGRNENMLKSLLLFLAVSIYLSSKQVLSAPPVPVLVYHFERSHCLDGTFQEANEDFSNLDMSSNGNCLQVERNNIEFDRAGNGISSPGGDIGNILRSALDTDIDDLVAALTTPGRFALEFWLKLGFDSSDPPSSSQTLVLLEVGDRTEDSPECSADQGFRLSLVRSSNGNIQFEARINGEGTRCTSLGATANIAFVKDTLYHVVINFLQFDDESIVDRERANIFITDSNGSDLLPNRFAILGYSESTRNAGNEIDISNWSSNDWILHLGTSPEAASTIDTTKKAFKGDIFKFAIYEGNLEEPDRNALFNSFIINNPPAAANYTWTIEENSNENLDFTTLVYDLETELGISGASVSIEILEITYTTINEGTFYDGTPSPSTIFSNPKVLEDPEDFHFGTEKGNFGEEYAVVRFRVEDEQQETSLPDQGFLTINVQQVNDPPEAFGSPVTVQVKQGVAGNIVFRARDPDGNDNAEFGLKEIRIDEIPASLGTVRQLGSGSECDGATVNENDVISSLSLSSTNEFEDVLTLCVEAGSNMGTFNILFTVIDQNDDEDDSGIVPVQVISGLGAECRSNGDPCVVEGMEEEERLIEIFAEDTLGSRDENQLQFVIERVPSNGRIFQVDSSDEKVGSALEEGSTIQATDKDDTVVSVKLLYEPNSNYFNKICTNRGTPSLASSGDLNDRLVSCTPESSVATTKSAQNTANQGFFGCSNSQGCPDVIEYKLQTSDESDTSSSTGRVNMFIFNTFDELESFSTPSELTFEYDDKDSSTREILIKEESDFQIVDPDQGANQISIVIKWRSDAGSFSIRSSAPNVKQIFGGIDCFENGCAEIGLRGYTRQINSFLETVFISLDTPEQASKETLDILVFQLTAAQLGITEALFSGTRFTRSIEIEHDQATTSASTSTTEIIIFSVIGVVGFLILIAILNGVAIVCRTTGKAAAAARKSISRRSTRKSDIDPEAARALEAHERAQQPCLIRWCPIFACCCASNVNHSQAVNGEHALTVSGDKSDSKKDPPPQGKKVSNSSTDGAELQVADDSIFDWEKHIDKRTGDTYFFNPKTGVSQWDPPTVKAKRTKK